MVAALAFAGGACSGDDDGDVNDDAPVESTVVDESGDSSESGDVAALRERFVAQFEALGMTEDQANCLIGHMDAEDIEASGGQLDPSMFVQLYSECGIDFDQQPGG